MFFWLSPRIFTLSKHNRIARHSEKPNKKWTRKRKSLFVFIEFQERNNNNKSANFSPLSLFCLHAHNYSRRNHVYENANSKRIFDISLCPLRHSIERNEKTHKFSMNENLLFLNRRCIFCCSALLLANINFIDTFPNMWVHISALSMHVAAIASASCFLSFSLLLCVFFPRML